MASAPRPAPSAVERRSADSAKKREERRRLARIQEVEQTISALEAALAAISAQLEQPHLSPQHVAALGQEYERLQRQIDEKPAEWERLQS